MKQAAIRMCVALAAATLMVMTACGPGGSKPPMVPDQPGDPSIVGDSGAEMPAIGTPPSPK
jgi:hypothetical protein